MGYLYEPTLRIIFFRRERVLGTRRCLPADTCVVGLGLSVEKGLRALSCPSRRRPSIWARGGSTTPSSGYKRGTVSRDDDGAGGEKLLRDSERDERANNIAATASSVNNFRTAI